jgi:hypothetical protein
VQITKEKTSEGPALFPAGDGPAEQSKHAQQMFVKIRLEVGRGVPAPSLSRDAPHTPSRGDSAVLTSSWNSANSLASISLIAQKWSPALVQCRMLKPCTFVVLAG